MFWNCWQVSNSVRVLLVCERCVFFSKGRCSRWMFCHLCSQLRAPSGSIASPPLPPSKCQWPLFSFPHMKAKELRWITAVIKTQGERKRKKKWKTPTQKWTSMSRGPEKRALLCWKSQERGRRSARSAIFFFFNGKRSIIKKSRPLFLCGCFPCFNRTRKKKGGKKTSAFSIKWQRGCWPAGCWDSTCTRQQQAFLVNCRLYFFTIILLSRMRINCVALTCKRRVNVC